MSHDSKVTHEQQVILVIKFTSKMTRVIWSLIENACLLTHDSSHDSNSSIHYQNPTAPPSRRRSFALLARPRQNQGIRKDLSSPFECKSGLRLRQREAVVVVNVRRKSPQIGLNPTSDSSSVPDSVTDGSATARRRLGEHQAESTLS